MTPGPAMLGPVGVAAAGVGAIGGGVGSGFVEAEPARPAETASIAEEATPPSVRERTSRRLYLNAVAT